MLKNMIARRREVYYYMLGVLREQRIAYYKATWHYFNEYVKEHVGCDQFILAQLNEWEANLPRKPDDNPIWDDVIQFPADLSDEDWTILTALEHLPTHDQMKQLEAHMQCVAAAHHARSSLSQSHPEGNPCAH